MNGWEAFEILGIDVTDDKKAIKKAYAKLVKQYHPEEYPEEWEKIHEAYETALKGMSSMQIPVGRYSERGEKTDLSDFSLTEEDGIDHKKEHQENEILSEEQEIDQMFDHIEELVQEKQEDTIDEGIQKLKKLSGITPRERINTAKKYKKRIEILMGIATYFIIIAVFMAAYKHGGTSKKETTKEKKISSYEDLQEMTKQENDRWYRGPYLPTLAAGEDGALQKAELDRSIYLQEGIYLTLQRDDMQAETAAFSICEAELPKQLETFTGEGIWDCRFRAFCISSNAGPECAILWCDMEKLGFGDAVRIFYYDEEKQVYVEVVQFGEEYSAEKYSYGILDHRTFIIDTHVHEEGEACRHPIVFIEKIKKK